MLRACEEKKEKVHFVGHPLARRPVGYCWRHHVAGGLIGNTFARRYNPGGFVPTEMGTHRKMEVPKGESDLKVRVDGATMAS